MRDGGNITQNWRSRTVAEGGLAMLARKLLCGVAVAIFALGLVSTVEAADPGHDGCCQGHGYGGWRAPCRGNTHAHLGQIWHDRLGCCSRGLFRWQGWGDWHGGAKYYGPHGYGSGGHPIQWQDGPVEATHPMLPPAPAENGTTAANPWPNWR